MSPKKSKQKNKAVIKLTIIFLILLILPRTATMLVARTKYKTLEDVGHYETAIILAAEVHPNGRPSAVLRDRIETGIELYKKEKVNTLVMSGDVPEPEIMRAYAIAQGVPSEAILLDNHGLRSYDTCYRAANVFGLEETIVVTQLFHLPRTLLLCSQMGLEVVGVPAQHTVFWPHQTLWWQTRETLATVLAYSDLFLAAPEVSSLPYSQ